MLERDADVFDEHGGLVDFDVEMTCYFNLYGFAGEASLGAGFGFRGEVSPELALKLRDEIASFRRLDAPYDAGTNDFERCHRAVEIVEAGGICDELGRPSRRPY